VAGAFCAIPRHILKQTRTTSATAAGLRREFNRNSDTWNLISRADLQQKAKAAQEYRFTPN
jgi:plasmid maintenance system antidote protein VapI